MLWANRIICRHTSRYTRTLSGVGSRLIKPSLAMNTSAPSRIEALIMFQMISPSVTYGRCSESSRWNSGYSPPIATAVVPVAMVIQNGPSTERRYFA